jgi:hypothetical protein
VLVILLASIAGRREARHAPAGRQHRHRDDLYEHVKPAHIIRCVLLRQIAILNYINPF